MKKILLSTVFALLFVANVHGKPPAYGRMTGTSTSDLEKIKFGVHLYSILFGHKVGAFVEYKIREAVGLQTGLLYFNDFYGMQGLEGNSDKKVIVNPGHLSVPLIARFYPGEGRQFCMFAGLQINYLVGGDLIYADEDKKGKVIESILLPFSKDSSSGSKKKYKIKDTSAHGLTISNWGSHALVGFDYESLGGFQLGLECGFGLSNLAKCKETLLNWTFKPTLGYNFAKLLN